MLANAAKERIIGLVERMGAAPWTDAAVRQLSDFYCSWMDQSTIKMQGWWPTSSRLMPAIFIRKTCSTRGARKT
ncbi:hypothetical protein [Janthinobacterium sp. LB2P10]|uniref:hypothetical protein n=1 Tax=Janthinobacterium sp. LB2P10 TaxID=3424194 RepID=UPI003F208C79